MGIGIFKRRYFVRKHTPQTFDRGHASSRYTDTATMLNVQPLSSNELQALPEGERTVKRVKSYGAGQFDSANEHTGIPGDMLYYMGMWYECKSSQLWDHTPLAHYESEFVLIADQSSIKPPLEVSTP